MLIDCRYLTPLRGSDMKWLDVAVLGCCFRGKNHARIFNEIDSCNFVAVADIMKELKLR